MVVSLAPCKQDVVGRRSTCRKSKPRVFPSTIDFVGRGSGTGLWDAQVGEAGKRTVMSLGGIQAIYSDLTARSSLPHPLESNRGLIVSEVPTSCPSPLDRRPDPHLAGHQHNSTPAPLPPTRLAMQQHDLPDKIRADPRPASTPEQRCARFWCPRDSFGYVVSPRITPILRNTSDDP